MARHKADPGLFLSRLEAARRQAKRGEIVNQTQLAEVLGMTGRNLVETYVKPDPDFPILERGSEGKGYRYDLNKVLAHLVKRTRAMIAANEKRNIAQAERLGVTVPEEDRGIPLSELREQIDLSLKVQAERRRQEGEIDPVKAAAFLERYNQTMCETILGTGSAIDPTGELPAAMRARFDNHMRDLCLVLQAQARKFIEESRARAVTSRAG